MTTLVAGSRVCFQGNQKQAGTVEGFVLHEGNLYDHHNGILAYVRWDNGKDDWYNGNDLRLLEEPTELRRMTTRRFLAEIVAGGVVLGLIGLAADQRYISVTLNDIITNVFILVLIARWSWKIS